MNAEADTPRPATYSSNDLDGIPDEQLESANLTSLAFDDVTVTVRRIQVEESYFVLYPPNGDVVLCMGRSASNRAALQLAKRRLPDVRRMRAEMLKRFSKGSPTCRYETGDVAYVMGRPFMLRVNSAMQGKGMRHASRGRATPRTVVDPEVSLVELQVLQTGSYEQRRGCFMSWASGVLTANAARLGAKVCEAAGLERDVLPEQFRVRPMRDALLKLDYKQGVCWLSEDLVGLVPACVSYAFALRLAESRGLAGDDLSQFVEKACPERQAAKEAVEKAGLTA